ncbi:MAG TPA: hypothetical protein PLO52_00330 [Flavobacterium alvei]|nr:hypothetical protein [Flavobacterium alvei]
MGGNGIWLGKEQFSFAGETDSRAFSGVAYSGGEITDRFVIADDGEIYSKLVIDVPSAGSKTMKQNPSLRVPSFYNHDQNQIVGNGKLHFSNDIKITGKISEHTAEGNKIYNLMKEGFPMQQSIYVETDHIQGFKSGSVNVNGQEFQAPIAVFRNGFIREVSLCPIGADPNTSAEIFSVNQNKKGEIKMNMEKFSFMSKEEKEKYVELSKTDAHAAFEFACSCQEKHDEGTKSEADQAAKAKEDEEKKKKQDGEVAAAAVIEEASKTIKTLSAQVEKLENKIKTLEEAKVEIEFDSSLFKKDENKDSNAKLSTVLERTKVLMAERNLGYNQAYSLARAEAIKA